MIDEAVQPLLDGFVASVCEVAAVEAIWLHGSLALGDYQLGRSDLDVVAVVSSPPTPAVAELHQELMRSDPLAAKLIEHTWQQVEKLRGLVTDGTFQTYDHWWRSSSYSEAIYDEDDRNEQLAFVRDITLEAKIDRTTGVLDIHLAGWATDFRTHNSWGRTSMTDR